MVIIILDIIFYFLLAVLGISLTLGIYGIILEFCEDKSKSPTGNY
jgi:hypothetical protein